MLALLSHAFAALLAHVKHYVLDAAHPLPRRVLVTAPPVDTLEGLVMEEVCSNVPLDGLVLEHDPDATTSSVRVDGEAAVTGPCAIVRFLGRLWRSYPVTPANALLVDSALERLHDFLSLSESEGDALAAQTLRHVGRLEHECFEDGAPYLHGFGRPTIADVAWCGAIRWVVENDVCDFGDGDYPCMAEWWSAVRPEYVVVDTDDEDDVAQVEEEEKKES